MFCDNTSAIAIAKNPIQHKRSKNIDLRHHFIRDQVEQGTIKLRSRSSEDQIADIMAKPLPIDRYVKLRIQLGIISPTPD